MPMILILIQIPAKSKIITLLQSVFFHSVAMFCHGFQYNLQGPAWAVDSCSTSPPTEGTFQNVIFQTLQLVWLRPLLASYSSVFGSQEHFDQPNRPNRLGSTVVMPPRVGVLGGGGALTTRQFNFQNRFCFCCQQS